MKHARVLSIATIVSSVVFSCTSFDTSLDEVTLLPPDGPYAVGQAEFTLVDQNRFELYTFDQEDKRRIAVTVYYPAGEASNGFSPPYMRPQLAAAVAEAMGWDELALVERVHHHSFADLPISDEQDRYPVLFFSHGSGVQKEFYTCLLQYICSYGYVVINVSHPYDEWYTLLDGDQLVSNHDPGLGYDWIVQIMTDQEKALLFERGIHPPMDRQMAEVLKSVMRRVVSDPERLKSYYTTSMHDRAEDILFLIDFLHDTNREDSYATSRLDLSRIGVAGHSLGGATAYYVCTLSDEPSFGLDIDGYLMNSHPDDLLSNSFAFIMGDRGVDGLRDRDEEDAINTIVRNNPDTSYSSMENVGHSSFVTDLYLMRSRNEQKDEIVHEVCRLVLQTVMQNL